MRELSQPLKRAELLALPSKPWAEPRVYDWLYLLPGCKRHDSGYGLWNIVGAEIRGQGRESTLWAEGCAFGDDLHLDRFPPNAELKFDIEWPSRVIRMWSWRWRFSVGLNVSTTHIVLVPKAPLTHLVLAPQETLQ